MEIRQDMAPDPEEMGDDLEMGSDVDMTAEEDMKSPELTPVVLSGDFAFDGMSEWTASYTDYTAPVEGQISFVSEIRARPNDLSSTGDAYFLSGRNSSDDLYMFLKSSFGASDGLVADTTYEVSWTVGIASNVASGCIGIGGSPGESVYIKGGASQQKPENTATGADEEFRLNVDKGNQASEGTQAANLGTIGTSQDCSVSITGPWERLELSGVVAEPISTDTNGDIWLFVGSDSGFEGTTELYYLDYEVVLTPVM